MTVLGGPLRKLCTLYGRLLGSHPIICVCVASAILAAALVLGILGSVVVDTSKRSTFYQLLPDNSLLLAQTVVGTYIQNEDTETNVFRPKVASITATIDFRAQVPFGRQFLNVISSFQDEFLAYSHNAGCSDVSVSLSDYVVDYEEGGVHYPTVLSPLCMFNHSKMTLDSFTDVEIEDTIQKSVKPDILPTVCNKFLHNAPRWSITDSLADPKFNSQGDLVSASGAVLKFFYHVPATCELTRENIVNEEANVYDGGSYKEDLRFIDSYFTAMKQGKFIDKQDFLKSASVGIKGDSHHMIEYFIHNIEKGNIFWGLIPLTVLLLVFMHSNVAVDRYFIVRSRICLFIIAATVAATSALDGYALLWAVGKPCYFFNPFCTFLSLGLSVDGVLLFLSHIPRFSASSTDPARGARVLIINALQSCGPSFVCTTITTIMAGACTMLSPVPALESFGVQAASSAAFAFLLIVFVFLPFLSLYLYRVSKDRTELFIVKVDSQKRATAETDEKAIRQFTFSLSNVCKFVSEFDTWRPFVVLCLIAVVLLAVYGLMSIGDTSYSTDPSLLVPHDIAWKVASNFERKHVTSHTGHEASIISLLPLPLVNVLPEAIKLFNSFLTVILQHHILADDFGDMPSISQSLIDAMPSHKDSQSRINAQNTAMRSIASSDVMRNIPSDVRINSFWEDFIGGTQYTTSDPLGWPETIDAEGQTIVGEFLEYVDGRFKEKYTPDNVTSTRAFFTEKVDGYESVCQTITSFLAQGNVWMYPIEDFQAVCLQIAPTLDQMLRGIPLATSIPIRPQHSSSLWLNEAMSAAQTQMWHSEIVRIFKGVVSFFLTYKTPKELTDSLNKYVDHDIFTESHVAQLLELARGDKAEDLVTFVLTDFGSQYASELDQGLENGLALAFGGVFVACFLCVFFFFEFTLGALTLLVLLFEYLILFAVLQLCGVDIDIAYVLFAILSSGLLADPVLHLIYSVSGQDKNLPARTRVVQSFSTVGPALFGAWATTILAPIGALSFSVDMIPHGYVAFVVIQTISLVFFLIVLPAVFSVFNPDRLSFVQFWGVLRHKGHDAWGKSRGSDYSVETDKLLVEHAACNTADQEAIHRIKVAGHSAQRASQNATSVQMEQRPAVVPPLQLGGTEPVPPPSQEVQQPADAVPVQPEPQDDPLGLVPPPQVDTLDSGMITVPHEPTNYTHASYETDPYEDDGLMSISDNL